jgi:hypothetical protein
MDINSAALLTETLIAALPHDRRPDEAEVLALGSQLRLAFPVNDLAFEEVIKSVHARLAINMDMGTYLASADHAPWLAARKAEIEPFYWDRFRRWLGGNQWAPLVVNTLDGVTDDILDLTGNPASDGAWSRRGLVVGDVQSGKTATYTALTCKASDAGYKLIILLTGTLESLRRQTQERLDEGFVGFDSSELLQSGQIKKDRAVGVGLIDARHYAGVFTSRAKDFNKDLMNQLGFRLDAFQVPVLVVVKKNKRILNNLESWLRGYNLGAGAQIAAPMLLIDDEADSASINTADPKADPTAINSALRRLLALFSHSTYVGFTATPFANVFIEPESEDAMLGDDLFPKDFIYSLEAPDNYVGPAKVFGDELRMVRYNDDAEAFFPPGHKSHHAVDSLPGTLRDALASFILSTTLRDLRCEGPTHRSMLVNVSQYTAVQDRVANLLDSELRAIQRDIRNYAALPVEEALGSSDALVHLHEVWLKEHDNAGFSWFEVQASLNEAVQPITVRSVNQRTGAASLDYKAQKEHGLRVIAVGGNSLSRGLTLEGLSTSYFFRNSQMYDTLMQMGRWFGYRDGYADLCRLWLGQEAEHWYAHITDATEELRSEFKRMRRLDLTPREFGLKVRAHPDALLVTARNKMRSAETYVREVSLSAEGIETARLWDKEAALDANQRLAHDFVARIDGLASADLSRWENWIWRDIPSDLVADFVEQFQAHPLNYTFQGEDIARFLRDAREPKLTSWDVVLPKGSADPPVTIAGKQIKRSLRRLALRKGSSSILVSGSRARVGSRGIEREGLSDEEYEEAVRGQDVKNIADRDYRAVRSRPLLLVHFLKGYTRPDGDPNGDPVPYRPDGPELVAIGLSFPRFDDSTIHSRVVYKVNAIEWASLVRSEDGDDWLDEDEQD